MQNLPHEQSSSESFPSSSLPETKVLFGQNSPLLPCRILFPHLNLLLKHLKAASVSIQNSELPTYLRPHAWSLFQYTPPSTQWEDKTTNVALILEDNGQTGRVCFKICVLQGATHSSARTNTHRCCRRGCLFVQVFAVIWCCSIQLGNGKISVCLSEVSSVRK